MRMNEFQDKIDRFLNMTSADPTNDMAHFSLGSAYLDAEQYEEAVASFEECVKLNAEMTRAMELGGVALLQLGRTDEASNLLAQGYTQAAERGEMRVKDGIATAMQDAGFELPEVEHVAKKKSGKPLEEAPLPGAIGKWILEHVDADLWGDWIAQGTKVINELRLDFARAEDQKAYEEYMIEFLGVPNDVVETDRKVVTE